MTYNDVAIKLRNEIRGRPTRVAVRRYAELDNEGADINSHSLHHSDTEATFQTVQQHCSIGRRQDDQRERHSSRSAHNTTPRQRQSDSPETHTNGGPTCVRGARSRTPYRNLRHLRDGLPCPVWSLYYVEEEMRTEMPNKHYSGSTPQSHRRRERPKNT